MSSKNFEPLQWFPYEIWVQLIQYYAYERPEGALLLLNVSPSWNEHLIYAPEIWRHIYLDGGHDEECRAECFFHLSKSLLVELNVFRSSNAVVIMRKYRERIGSLVFCGTQRETYTQADMSQFSSEIGAHTYPNLVYIRVDPPSDYNLVVPQSLLKACAALIGIQGASVDQKTIYMVPSLIMSGIIGDGLGLVNQLEDLRLIYVSSQQDSRYNSDHFRIPSARLKRLELSAGTHVPINSSKSYSQLIREFGSYSYHALKVLVVTMPWYEIAHLTPCLSDCAELRELTLHLDFSVDVNQPEGSAVKVMGIDHIRKLSILSVPASIGNRWVSNACNILQALVQGGDLQDLEELCLNLDFPSPQNSQIPDLLRRTKKLRKLHLEGCTLARPYDLDKVVLSYVHALVLDNRSHIQYLELPELVCLTSKHLENTPATASLSLFSSGKLASLTMPSSFYKWRSRFMVEGDIMTQSSFYKWNDLFMTKNIDNKPLEGLLTLGLATSYFTATPTYPLNLSNLQSISFEGHNGVPLRNGELVGKSSLVHFMLELLMSPENCPRLHTIRAEQYPNWAVTTAAFYRRNSVKTVTPITSLWLCGYPQVGILTNIVDALKALDEFPERSILAAARFDHVIKQRSEINFFRKRACPGCITCGYVNCLPSSLDSVFSSLLGFQFNPPDPPNDDAKITMLLDIDPGKDQPSTPSLLSLDEWKCHLQVTECVWSSKEPVRISRCPRHTQQGMVVYWSRYPSRSHIRCILRSKPIKNPPKARHDRNRNSASETSSEENG